MLIKNYKNFILENLKAEMPLPEDIIKIAKLYHDNDKELLVVGGSVRDFLQNKKPHDYDLVTNALPEESKEILKNMNVSDEQGKKFGVLRVYTKDEPSGYEIASYRRDISGGRDTKGDNEKVEMGHHLTINDDCLRRDITSNALYYDINKKEIIDLVGGVEDIRNGIIRAVGKASDRFSEDRLRICRIFRFASRGELKIDKDTSDAIKRDKRLRNVSKIDDVSQERIVEEFVKAVDWASEHKKMEALHYYLELLEKYDMFEEMFPDLDIDIEGINTFNLTIIFALLFRNNEIEKLRNRLSDLKFPNKIADKACFLLRLKENIKTLDKIPSLYDEKVRYHVDNHIILEFADLYKFNNNYLKAFLKYHPKVDAFELMKKGLKDAELGREIKRLKIEEFKNLLQEKLIIEDYEELRHDGPILSNFKNCDIDIIYNEDYIDIDMSHADIDEHIIIRLKRIAKNSVVEFYDKKFKKVKGILFDIYYSYGDIVVCVYDVDWDSDSKYYYMDLNYPLRINILETIAKKYNL